MYKLLLSFFILSLSFTQIIAGEKDNSPIYTKSIDKPLDAVYDSVYAALENEKFWVIFEPNIGKNLTNMAGRLAKIIIKMI
jgi:hypothetical protein